MFTERFGSLAPGVLAGLLTALVAAPAAADGLASRYTTTGALDATFNGSGNGSGKLISPGNVRWEDVLVDSNGKVVLCGSVNGQLAIARRLATGAADASFGLGGITTASWSSPAAGVGCARTSDGKIVILSSATSSTKDWLLTRFTATGQLDTSFGSNGFASVSFPNTPQAVPADIEEPVEEGGPVPEIEFEDRSDEDYRAAVLEVMAALDWVRQQRARGNLPS